MLFNSYSFLFAFLPITLLLFLAVRRCSLNAGIAWLALASFVFYSLVRVFLENLKESEFQFVGISDVLVPNLRYKLYRKRNGDQRYVAML